MASDPLPRLLPLGDAAWIVEFGSRVDDTLNARVMGLAAALDAARPRDGASGASGAAGAAGVLAGITDVVPTFRSLAVHFDPLATDGAALGQQLLQLAAGAGLHRQQGRLWRLPVCFDADWAPDMPRLCAARALAPQQVVDLLCAATFRVHMIGFLPGFAYMGGLPEALAMPRLPTPRQKVPAQSLAVAGTMCGVYPWDSPGGWNLLGRMPVPLFDAADVASPALLAAGDRIRWHAVDRAGHDRLVQALARGLPRRSFMAGGDDDDRATDHDTDRANDGKGQA